MNLSRYDRPPEPPQPYGRLPEAPPPRTIEVRVPGVKPTATYVIIALSVLIYIAQYISEIAFGGDIPAALGMKINEYIIAGQYWRLFTPMLLHGSIMHIGFNMYALYAIGRGLEMHYGHLRYLMLYVIGGFAGNVVSFLLSPNPSLGASTAIFGLLGAEAIFVYKNREIYGANARSILLNILVLMAINLALGLSPGIDNWGHMGGLIGGLVFAWFAGPVWKMRIGLGGYKIEDERSMRTAWIVALLEAAVLAGLVLQRILMG